MRKHFSDIAGSDADAVTDADTNPNANTYADADANPNAHTDADADAGR